MGNIEHWLCTNCGTIDGARAGMVCHGPRFTGICMALGETVVEISPGAVKRLQGAVEDRDAAYRQRDRHYLALRLAVGDDAVAEWLARADAERGQ